MRFWEDMTEANSVNEDDVFMLGDAANPNLPKFVRKKNLGVALPSWSFEIPQDIGKWFKIGTFTSGMVSFVRPEFDANCILNTHAVYGQSHFLKQSQKLAHIKFRMSKNNRDLYVYFGFQSTPNSFTLTAINKSTEFTPIEPIGYTIAEIESTTNEAIIDIALKQNKDDNALQTTDKTIVGAINELNSLIQNTNIYPIVHASDVNAGNIPIGSTISIEKEKYGLSILSTNDGGIFFPTNDYVSHWGYSLISRKRNFFKTSQEITGDFDLGAMFNFQRASLTSILGDGKIFSVGDFISTNVGIFLTYNSFPPDGISGALVQKNSTGSSGSEGVLKKNIKSFPETLIDGALNINTGFFGYRKKIESDITITRAGAIMQANHTSGTYAFAIYDVKTKQLLGSTNFTNFGDNTKGYIYADFTENVSLIKDQEVYSVIYINHTESRYLACRTFNSSLDGSGTINDDAVIQTIIQGVSMEVLPEITISDVSISFPNQNNIVAPYIELSGSLIA